MAFDLATAQPVGGFDLATAKPVAPDASTIPTGQGGSLLENLGASVKAGLGTVAGNVGRVISGAFTPDPEERSIQSDYLKSKLAESENKYGGSKVYQAGKLATEIGATWPVGGMLGEAAGAANLPRLANALTSSGFTTGAAAPTGILGHAVDLGIRTVGGAATGGATAALVNPDEAGMGAAIGGALPGVLKVFGMAGNGLVSAVMPRGVDPARAALAQQLIDRGVDVLPSQLTRSPLTKATASILKDAPITGGMARGALDKQTGQFNTALANTIGVTSNTLDEATAQAAKAGITGKLDAIWGSNNLKVTEPFFDKLVAIREQALREMPGPQGQGLANKIEDFLNKVEKGDQISGEAANRFQSSLRGMPDDLSAQTRREVVNAFNASIGGPQAKALGEARNQYRNFKTLEPLIAKSTTGDISPANLLTRVAAQGNPPDLVSLARGGKEFLVDRTAQTGGSARALIQNALTGSTVGAGLTLGIPTTAVGLGGLATIGALVQKGLVSPEIGQKMVENALRVKTPGRAAKLNALLAPLYDPATQLGYRAAPLRSTSQ